MEIVKFSSVLIALLQALTKATNGFVYQGPNSQMLFIPKEGPEFSWFRMFQNVGSRYKRSNGDSQVSKRNLDSSQFKADSILDPVQAEENSGDRSESRGKRVISPHKGKLWNKSYVNMHPNGRPGHKYPSQFLKDEEYDLGDFYDLLRALRESPAYDDIEKEIGEPDMSLLSSKGDADGVEKDSGSNNADKSETNLDISIEIAQNLCALQDEYDETRKIPTSTEPKQEYLEKYLKSSKNPGQYSFVWVKCAEKNTDKKPCGWYELRTLE